MGPGRMKHACLSLLNIKLPYKGDIHNFVSGTCVANQIFSIFTFQM